LDAGAQPAVAVLDATDDRIAHVELGSELGDIHLAVAIEVRGAVGDDPQVAEAGERRRQVVGQQPGEGRVARVAGASIENGSTIALASAGCAETFALSCGVPTAWASRSQAPAP